MNIHHLELFYYVARHGGITEAVRNIPYGIQQPAVSGQVAQLEEYLGVTLFQRRPFALTPAGNRLYEFSQPFFSNLDVVAGELQAGKTRQIRLGASPIVLREHLPGFLKAVQRKNPRLNVALKEGTPAILEDMLEREELDLAVSATDNKPGRGIQCLPLIELPLALLVPVESEIQSPSQLWSEDKIKEPLVSLPPTEVACKHFQQGLIRLGVDWFPTIEVSSLDLVETYVANGFGIGVSVRLPDARPLACIRVLPLDPPEFAPIKVVVLWRGKLSAVLQAVLDELQLAAKRLSSPPKAPAAHKTSSISAPRSLPRSQTQLPKGLTPR